MNPNRPSREELEAVVREVLVRLRAQDSPAPRASLNATGSMSSIGSTASTCGCEVEGAGLFRELDAAVAAAQRAFQELRELSLTQRKGLIRAMRDAARADIAELSRLAVEETGLGRAEDKVEKNLLVTERTPGAEILEAWAVSGDHGLTLQEWAPWGVLGVITPCTNPTETIICNSIGMVAAGNSMVFCPHPLARKVSARLIVTLNRAIAAAGGPASLLCALSDPSIELAQALMRHPGIRLLVVTGGPGVVREAMRSGKRVIGAGPGNPPSLVDETADLERAGRDLVRGASLDNNIICTDEKEVFVVGSVADRLKGVMEANGAQEIRGPQVARLAGLLLASRERHSEVRKEWVGKDASRILEAIGARARPETRLVLVEVEADHPLVWTEQLTPVLPLVRVRTAEEGMELAIAAERGLRHTATMHSHDVTRLSAMARRVDTSIFVKNGPSFAGLGMGGEGYTSFTIAGATGEGMTDARHFCRLRRCALIDSFRIV